LLRPNSGCCASRVPRTIDNLAIIFRMKWGVVMLEVMIEFLIPKPDIVI
jgi:hypothetical protein